MGVSREWNDTSPYLLCQIPVFCGFGNSRAADYICPIYIIGLGETLFSKLRFFFFNWPVTLAHKTSCGKEFNN